MDTAQSDLVEWYKLETEFFQDHVRHTRYVEKGENRYVKRREDWSNCGELGKGGFGVVYKQVQKTTGRYRAVKTINKKILPSNLDYSRELLVMAILAKRPELFVKFLGWYENPETLYIAMEYLPEGDLTKHTGSPLPQATVQTISKQILEGLKVMHQNGIAHRDLKPANIFVVSMSPVRIKLGDFGISKRVRPEATTEFVTQVSTQAYGAPEVLGLDSYSEGKLTIRDLPRSQWGSDPTARKPEIDTAMTIQGAEEKTDPQYSTNMSPKPPASDPPTLDLDSYRENNARLTLGTSGLGRHTPKREASAPDSPTRIAGWQTYPAQQSGAGSDDSGVESDGSENSEDESLQNPMSNARSGGGGPVVNPMKNPNTRQNSNAGLNPNAGWNPNQNPNVGRNPNQNPNVGWNPNQNPNVGWNPNQNPNVGWNPNQNPNASSNPNWNPNVNSNPNQNPNAGSNPNQNPNLSPWALRTGGNPNNTAWSSSAPGNRNPGQIDTC